MVFLLLFRYVFGGVVPTSLLDVPYVDYLMPGIRADLGVRRHRRAIGLGTDLQMGLLSGSVGVDDLPAVLAGRPWPTGSATSSWWR